MNDKEYLIFQLRSVLSEMVDDEGMTPSEIYNIIRELFNEKK
jgi:hypothetical protein